MITKEDLKAAEDFIEWQKENDHSPKPTPEQVDQVLATIRERGKVYGEPALSHHNIGLSWTGLIQQHYGLRLDHPLPAWLVELMLVAFKVHRAARVFHADNYVDAKAYLRFAGGSEERDRVSAEINPRPSPKELVAWLDASSAHLSDAYDNLNEHRDRSETRAKIGKAFRLIRDVRYWLEKGTM